MKARPILFSGPMVRALLEGRKTQTRRLVKPQPELTKDKGFVQADRQGKRWAFGLGLSGNGTERNFLHRCPYGQPGDLMYVRETWRVTRKHDLLKPCEIPKCQCTVAFAAGGSIANGDDGIWFPAESELWNANWMGKIRAPIHMPRWASRLTLRITDVRVQRLQEISGDDAKAEGVQWDAMGWQNYLHPERRKSSAAQSFETLWQSINGDDSWDANPWVWAISFEVIRDNVDAVLEAS